jgi:hypothetical protein
MFHAINQCRQSIKIIVVYTREIWRGKYHCTIDLLFDWFWINCMTTENFCFYLQNRLIKTSPTGSQWYSDTSPFSIPWIRLRHNFLCTCWPNPNSISDYRSEDTDEIVATEGSDAILATEGTDAVLATEGAGVSSPGTNDIKLFTDVIYVFS